MPYRDHATYRYYTCFTRMRYGTTAGCDAPRLNADTLDTAIGWVGSIGRTGDGGRWPTV